MDVWWWSDGSTANQGCSRWPQLVVTIDGSGGVNHGFDLPRERWWMQRHRKISIYECFMLVWLSVLPSPPPTPQKKKILAWPSICVLAADIFSFKGLSGWVGKLGLDSFLFSSFPRHKITGKEKRIAIKIWIRYAGNTKTG